MPYGISICSCFCFKLDIAVQLPMEMNTNLKKPQSTPPLKAKVNEWNDSFDFEYWAREVRTQLLAALQKRAGSSQRRFDE